MATTHEPGDPGCIPGSGRGRTIATDDSDEGRTGASWGASRLIVTLNQSVDQTHDVKRLRSVSPSGRYRDMTLPNIPSGRPPVGAHALLTITEVAEILGKDRSTIKTWLHKKRKYPHAAKEAGGLHEWKIPVEDLVAAGDIPADQVQHVQNELTTRRESAEVRELREKVIRLEEQLAAQTALAADRGHTIAWLQRHFSNGSPA